MVLSLGLPKGKIGSAYVSVNNYMCPMWVLHGLKFPCGTHMVNTLRLSPHVNHLALCAGVFFFVFRPQSTNFQSCRDGSSWVKQSLDR